MKRTRITIGTEPTCHVKFNRPVPGLLWAELVTLVSEYRRFEDGQKGTRFDRWLRKKVA